MNSILYRVICVVIGYICGLLLSGFFIGKKEGVDIRTKGSGNVGTTNTLRNLGVKPGTFTLIGDALKTAIAILLAWLIYRSIAPEQVSILMLYAALGSILGHDFPFYMHFKGGKGIACSFGMICVLFPKLLPICFIVFVIAVATTRYVSLGSILSAVAYIVQIFVFGLMGWQMGFVHFDASQMIEVYVLASIAAFLALFLHRANISRLINHKENKFSFHPNVEK